MSKMTALIWSGVGFGAAGVGTWADAGVGVGADANAEDIQTRCVIHNHFLSKLCKSLRVLSNATDLMNSITTPPQES